MGLMTDIPTKFSTLPLTINNLSFFESSKINPPPYSHEFSGTLKSYFYHKTDLVSLFPKIKNRRL